STPTSSPNQDYRDLIDLSSMFTFSKELQEENKKLKGKRAIWVTKDVLEQRRRNRQCYRCGRRGCNSRFCPLLPPIPPQTSSQSRPFQTKKKTLQVQFVE